MFDLIWRDVARHRAVWAGAALVAAATALFTTTCFNFLIAVYSAPAQVFTHPEGSRDDMLDIGANLLIFSGFPAVVVLGIVLSTLVSQTRQVHALYRLGGASPRQVLTIFTLQAVLTAAVGGLAGAVASVPLQGTVNTLLTRGTAPALEVSLTPVALVGSVLLVCVWGGAAAVLPAVQASRTSPLEGREPDHRDRRNWAPLILTGLFLLLIQLPLLGALIPSDRTGDPVRATLALLPAGQALVLSTALLAPLFLGPLLRLWTAVPGLTAWTPWRIARHMAMTRTAQSSATVIPLMVGIALFACFNMVGTVARNAAGPGGPVVNLFDGTLMLTPIGVIGAVGSAAVVFMSARRRTEDLTALRAAGASPAGTQQLFVCEAVIYVVTALITALIPIAAQLLVLTVPLSRWGAALDLTGLDLGAAIGVAAIGGLMTVGIVTWSGMRAWRRPLATALAER